MKRPDKHLPDIKLYSDAEDGKKESRALQIMVILVGYAMRKQFITYGELATLLGFGGAGTLGGILGCIAFWCKANGLPELNSIVINEDEGLPGIGFPGAYDEASHAKRCAKIQEQQRGVFFLVDWFNIMLPTPDQLQYANEHRDELPNDEDWKKHNPKHRMCAPK